MKLLTIIFSFVILLANTTVMAAPYKILPLGDSITSDGGDSAYRDELYDKLTTAGYDFEFVGSLPDDDTLTNGTKHEGHSGWRADEINNNLAGWLTGYGIDFALIHLGTNDIIQGQGNQTTLNDLEAIIDKLQTENQNITIFVAKIIPLFYLESDHVIAVDQTFGLNSLINGISDKSTSTSKVIVVDQHTGMTLVDDLSDRIHPNGTGEEKMAQKWFDALQTEISQPSETNLEFQQQPPSTAYRGDTITIVANSSNSDGNITYSTSSTTTSNICSVGVTSGEVVIATTAPIGNTCIVKATITASGNYASKTITANTITIVQQQQSISFNAPTTTSLDADFSVTASSTSNLAVAISSLTTQVCTINSSTNKVTPIKTGDCRLQATQAGNNIYPPANPVDRSITITKINQQITFASNTPTSRKITDSAFVITATSTVGLNVTVSSSTTNICEINTAKKLTLKNAGVCRLEATQAGNNNYASAESVSHTLEIKKNNQIITFASSTPTNKNTSDPAFVISATSNVGLNVTVSSATINICEIDTAKKLTLKKAGICRIEATQTGNNNYASAEPVSHTIEIKKSNQIVTFASNTPTIKNTSDEGFIISAISNVGLNVTVTSATSSICEIDTARNVTIKMPGDCRLIANQNGNDSYNPATATHLITINNSTDIITFSPITDKTLGDDDFIVEVQAKSGDEVKLESLTKTICEVGSNNHKVNLLSAGDCRLKAVVSSTTAEIIFTIKEKVIETPKDSTSQEENNSEESTPNTNPSTEEEDPKQQNSKAGALSLLWLLGLGLFSLLSRRVLSTKNTI
ncbi:MAG: SGNH/GDSL hydrolase family protein [Cocleimonas sp.]